MVATVIAGERRREGAALAARAATGVAALQALGIGEGAVIAVMLRNEIEFYEAMLMARLAGCYACLVNWHFKAEEAGFVLRDSGAAALIVHADLLGQMEGAIPEGMKIIAVVPSASLRAAFSLGAEACTVPPGCLEWETWLASATPYAGPPRAPRSFMPYSSGTTGRPKGIRREPPTAEQIARTAEMARSVLGVGPGTRTAAVTPLYHSGPALHAVQALLAGELIVVHPRFEAERLLADIERHRLDNLYLVPTLYVRLLRLPDEIKRRHDVSSVKFVASTGSPCPPDIKRAMIEWWGPVITETYASSETGLVTFCSAADALARPGTAGRPLPHVEARILDEAGNALPPGQPGLVYCRNRAYPDFTYVNNDAARRLLDRDGLVGVGDIGYFDEAGYLFICDRKADMVISGGVNIYPAEIEAALIAMPGVVDCAVFGIPDAEFGEALAAHVQERSGAQLSPDGVRAFLRERLATYKVPRIVVLEPELPREESGKIFKRKLREPYWREAGRSI